MTNMEPPSPSHDSTRITGMLLTLTSVLIVVFMAFHPRAHVHGKEDFVEAFAQIATVNAVVHGSLVALFLLLFYGLSVFADRLGADRPWVRLGTMLFAFGIVPLACAAILSGIVVPAYVAQFAGQPAASIEIVQQVVRLVHTVVITATRVGVLAVSFAILSWAIALVGNRPVLATIGFLAGGLPAVALACGYLSMDMHGMMFFSLAQATWGLSVGTQMMRGKI